MGFVQRDALKTMIVSYVGIVLGYLNKGFLFLLILNAEQIGLLNLLLALGLFFAQLSNLGTINTVSRFFALLRNKERGHYGLLRKLLLTVFAGILLTSLLTFLFEGIVQSYYAQNSSEFVDYYYWIIPIGAANVLYFLLENYLRAMFKNVIAVFVYEILHRLILTVLLLFYWFELYSFDVLLISFALSYVLPVMVLLVYLIYLGELQFLRFKPSIPKRLNKIILQYGMFSYLNSLGAIAIVTIDATMIASMIGLAGTGVYTTVQFITSALQVPFRSLYRVSAPFIPVYWKERNMDKMQELYRQVSGISLFIGLTMFLLVWLNRFLFIQYLPEGFEDAIWVFLFLMIGRLFDMYTGLNTVILINSKKYKADIVLTGMMLILVIVLNVLLIPAYGIIGSAIATSVAIITSNLVRVFYVQVNYSIHPFHIRHLAIVLFAGLTIFSVEFLSLLFQGNKILLFLGAQVSLLLLFVIPMCLFNLEPDVNKYLKKVLLSLKSSLN